MARSRAHRPGQAVQNAWVQREDNGSDVLLSIAGAWTVAQVSALDQQLRALLPSGSARAPQTVVIDASGLIALDTAGAWLIDKNCRLFSDRGSALSFAGLKGEYQELLTEVARANGIERDPVSKPNRLSQFAGDATARLSASAKDLFELVTFFGVFVAAAASALTFRSRFRLTSFVHHLDHAGLRAVPIIALICFLIGAVVMQQGAVQLSAYGAEPYAASMLGVLALREIGVLLTAVMVAGRSASAFTAEIGSMKMREEIDAMRTLGIDPVETLVVPRIMALLIALPLLTFVGDMMCLAGGAVVAVFYLDQPLVTFLERLQEAAEPRHFIAGMIKTPFAALVIGLVGCSEGLKVSGSAESLGQHVTAAVVKAIFLVIILGAVFAMFLVSMGV